MSEELPVVPSPRMTENHAGQPCYLVEYDEDQWFKYDKEGQEFCFAEWARKAKPMGAVFVVLRLVPDALFPMGKHEVPYIFRSHPIEQDTFNPVTISVKLSAEIHRDTWWNADDAKRHLIKTAARTELGMHAMACKGCGYEIWSRNYDGSLHSIEKGRM